MPVEIVLGDWLQTSRNFWVSYAVAAGSAWLLAYVLFKKRWWLRKVIQRDPRPSDVRREIGGALVTAGVFRLTIVGTMWLRELGWTQVYSKIDTHGLIWFWSSIVIAIIVHDAYFYWTHRLMHHPALFRWFHRLHHESKNPSPWASYCFGPLEAAVHAGIVPLLLTAVPMHLSALWIFLFAEIIWVVLGHTGYEFFPPWLMDSWLGKLINTPTNHVQHHERLRCNYGLYFNLWDRLMGTNHRDYESRFREVTTRPHKVRRSRMRIEENLIGSSSTARLTEPIVRHALEPAFERLDIKTAKTLGLEIPGKLLALADEAIE